MELLKKRIKQISEEFVNQTQKEVLVISHFDTDGISSAAIITKLLKKLDLRFSIKILKSLDNEFIKTLPEDKTILFLDLASNSLSELKEIRTSIFILDHHEITQEIPKNVFILNPHAEKSKQRISSAGLCYLFAKEIIGELEDISKLAVLGMVGDTLEKEIDILNHSILKSEEIKKKRGLLLYPSTRPINKVLEYSSSPFIPGVTGDAEGVSELLREISLTPENKKYKSLLELNQEEMKKLTTAIILRNPKTNEKKIIGDIFLLKFFNKLEDAREMSAMINACSRLGEPNTALHLCLEKENSRKKAETIYAKYRKEILSSIRKIKEIEKINGKGYIILNAKDQILFTIIGTLASILSNSPDYEEGTIIIALAYDQEKIKISARSVGNSDRNLRELLQKIMQNFDGEIGGHANAAGCMIEKKDEQSFIESIRKNLEIEQIKI